MADLSKIKKRSSLGAPPSPDEASQNLSAPETAPVHAPGAPDAGQGSDSVVPLRPSSVPPPSVVAADKVERRAVPAKTAKKRIDGRSLRKTGRTVPFSTRVSEEWDEKLRMIAQRDDLNFGEVLEKALDAYEGSRKK
jgi:hypothetical protein